METGSPYRVPAEDPRSSAMLAAKLAGDQEAIWAIEHSTKVEFGWTRGVWYFHLEGGPKLTWCPNTYRFYESEQFRGVVPGLIQMLMKSSAGPTGP